MRALVEAGLLRAITVPSTPVLALEGPVFAWSPGDPAPNFDTVAYALQTRWGDADEQPTRAYAATFKAAASFGGRGRNRYTRLEQATHDLHVTELYIRIRQEEPEIANHWVGEDLIAPELERFEKLADAEIRDGDQTLLYLEFGGRYGAREVRKKHEFFSGEPLRPGGPRRTPAPYEIW
ncbi:MAG: hypothetical protein RIE32_01695 [Phycisphaerales bacterium]